MVRKNTNGIVVLMYHGLDSLSEPSECTNKGDLIYVLDQEIFREQMDWLTAQNIPITTLSSHRNKRSCSKSDFHTLSLILTFDDGHITNYTKALPILKKYGFKAYFFITTDWIGTAHYMNEEMIRELHDAGMIIGSHGKTHKFLSDLNQKDIELELSISKSRLEDIIQQEVTCFSAPGGRVDNNVIRLAKKNGYSYIFSSMPFVNNSSLNNSYNIGRFAIKRGQTLSEFINLATGKSSFFEYLKFQVLRYTKDLLGNKKYEAIREYIIG